MGILTDQHAVVTGGATGIGLAISQAFGSAGAKVSIMARNSERAQSAAQSLSHGAAFTTDVTDGESVASAFSDATEHFGPVDILVNNAGGAATSPVHKMTLDQWQEMLAVNLTGTFLCSQAAIKDMRTRNKGRLINIASTAGLKGYAYTAAYCAAKHGVVGLTRSLAVELADSDITVNAVCPGFTDTDLVRASIANIVARTGRSADEALSELVKHNPQGRLIAPEEVAETVLWLCSEGAKSVTGQALAIAGGEVM